MKKQNKSMLVVVTYSVGDGGDAIVAIATKKKKNNKKRPRKSRESN